MAKRLTTACIVQLIGIAGENRDRQAQRLMDIVPGKIRSAEDAGIVPAAKRYQARKILLAEYRRQWRLVGSGEIAAVDLWLDRAVRDWQFRIFMQPNPVEALQAFLGLRQRPGKRAKRETGEREFRIALAVVRKMGFATDPKSKRMTLAKAAEAVAAADGRHDAEYIMQIYKRYRIAAKAAAFLERDPEVTGPDPLADILLK